jgi:hypothetical protein
MADQGDLETPLRVPACLCMNLRNERTDGVHDLELAFLTLPVDVWSYSVRGENDQGAFGHVLLAVDENRPARFQVADDMHIVDDLVSDVDRRAVCLEQLLDDVDRADDSRTEAPGRRDQDPLAHDGLTRNALAASSSAARARRASRAARIAVLGSVTKD